MEKETNSFDEAFEMLLTEAAIEADEHLGAELAEPNEEIVFSEEHGLKMKRMFRRERYKRRAKTASKWAARCACVAVAVTIAAGINGYGIVGAWKARFINFVYNRNEVNSRYSFEDGEMPEESAFSEFFLEYIPEGFEKTEYNQDDYSLFVKYENQEKYFYYNIEQATGLGGIDTEDAIVEDIEINGFKGIISVKEEGQILFWTDSTYNYEVIGNVGKDELMKIGENIKF